MNDERLVETNPYLKDKNAYEKSLFINISSSATIELGEMPSALKKALKTKSPILIFLSSEIEKEFSQ